MACKQSKDFEERMNGVVANSNHNSLTATSHQDGEEEGEAEGGALGESSSPAMNKNAFKLLSREKTISFFSRLVSIAHSELSSQEMYFVTLELWRRFNHVHSNS